MNALWAMWSRFLRGAQVTWLLQALGIDTRTYWLLLDLFGELSDRSELMDQLGSNSMNLQKLAWLYGVMSGLMALGVAAVRPPVMTYSAIFLGFTALVLLTVLALETGNSLVNPVEALVLSHHPIDGATYIGAKLTHLLRIVLYLTPGLSVIPALVIAWLPDSRWWFPIVHLLVSFGLGLLMALLCCALFGWLLRFVPAKRLKGAAQLVAAMPFALIFLSQFVREWMARLRVAELLPEQAVLLWAVAAALVVFAAWAVVAGIRCLSFDYLLRVSAITHGSASRVKVRRSRMGGLVARWFGGPPARAGFAFVSRMMRRDWQFRRQLIPSLVGMAIGFGGLLVSGWRKDPFAGGFTTIHFFPHVFGIVIVFVCCFLPYGNDHKAAWVFLLAPGQAFKAFARGVHALLWLQIVVIPHVLVLPLLAWSWGLWHAGIFVAYSLAIGSVYLAAALRLVDGPPFGQQIDPKRGAMLLPIMIGGGFVIAIMVGLQSVILFRLPYVAATAAVVFGAFAWVLTRYSIGAFEVAIRYRLGLLAEETGTLYQEVDA